MKMRLKSKASCLEYSIVLLFALALGIALSALVGWVFYKAWNFALVDSFGLPVLTFWKGWAITVILGIVGSFFGAQRK